MNWSVDVGERGKVRETNIKFQSSRYYVVEQTSISDAFIRERLWNRKQRGKTEEAFRERRPKNGLLKCTHHVITNYGGRIAFKKAALKSHKASESLEGQSALNVVHQKNVGWGVSPFSLTWRANLPGRWRRVRNINYQRKPLRDWAPLSLLLPHRLQEERHTNLVLLHSVFFPPNLMKILKRSKKSAQFSKKKLSLSQIDWRKTVLVFLSPKAFDGSVHSANAFKSLYISNYRRDWIRRNLINRRAVRRGKLWVERTRFQAISSAQCKRNLFSQKVSFNGKKKSPGDGSLTNQEMRKSNCTKEIAFECRYIDEEQRWRKNGWYEKSTLSKTSMVSFLKGYPISERKSQIYRKWSLVKFIFYCWFRLFRPKTGAGVRRQKFFFQKIFEFFFSKQKPASLKSSKSG